MQSRRRFGGNDFNDQELDTKIGVSSAAYGAAGEFLHSNAMNSSHLAAGAFLGKVARGLSYVGVAVSTIAGAENSRDGAVNGMINGFCDGVVSMIATNVAYASLIAVSGTGLAACVAVSAAAFAVGCVFSSMGVGSKLFRSMERGFKAAMNSAGLTGKGSSRGPGNGPGGVDISRVPRMVSLNADACVLHRRQLHAYIPLHIQWDRVNQLVNNALFPGQLMIPPSDIPMLILHECIEVMHVHNAPLLFSLHFRSQGDRDLYTVMHPALRNTLTGYILGFCDYYLKSFLNGGTYSEAYLRAYSGNANADELRANLIDLRKKLRTARRAGAPGAADLPQEYVTLWDMLDEDSTAGYHSAFRIVGDIEKLAHDELGAMEPTCTFRVESDLNMLPNRQAEVALAVVEGTPMREEHVKVVKAFEKMREKVRKDMPRMPGFEPYFELLRIITFCASLSHTLVEAGRLPPMDTHRKISLPPFPALMPPIPIRKLVPLHLQFSLKDWCHHAVSDSALRGDVLALERLLRARINSAAVASDVMAAADAAATAISRAAVRARVRELTAAGGGIGVDDLDDGELQVAHVKREALHNGVFALLAIFHAPLVEECCLMERMHILLPEGYTQKEAVAFIKERGKQFGEQLLERSTLSAKLRFIDETYIPDWKRRVQIKQQEEVNRLRRLLTHRFEKLTHEISEALAAKETEIRAEIEKAIASDHSGFFHAEIRKQGDQLFASTREDYAKEEQRIRAEQQQQLEKIISDMLADIASQQQELQASMRSAATRLQSREGQEGIVARGADHEMLKLHVILEQLRLTKLDVPDADHYRLGVVGGCGLATSTVRVQKSVEVTQRHALFMTDSTEEQLRVDAGGGEHRRYLHWCLLLEQALTHSHWLLSRYAFAHEQSDLLLQVKRVLTATLDSTQPLDASASDAGGGTLAHCCALSYGERSAQMLDKFDESALNKPRCDGFRPLDAACISGNLPAVKRFLQKGVSVNHVLPNGLSPLLMAAQENHPAVAMALLTSAAVENIDHSTDTMVTSLHWAVIHNHPALVEELVARGAQLVCRRSDSATPLHLAMANGYTACAEILIRRFQSSLTALLTADQRNVLHHAVAGNQRIAVKTLADVAPKVFIELLGQKDCSKLTPLDTALLHGYHNLAVEMITYGEVESLTNRCNLDLVADVPFLAERFNLKKVTPDISISIGGGGSGVSSSNKISSAALDTQADIDAQIMETFRENSNAPQKLPDVLRRKYLLHVAASRNLGGLQLMTRMLKLSRTEMQLLVRFVAEEGMLSWVKALKEAGVDVAVPLNSHGDTILDVAALRCDEKLFIVAWKEVTKIVDDNQRLLDLLDHCADSALKQKRSLSVLIHVLNSRRTILKRMQLTSGSITINGDVLLKQLDTTPLYVTAVQQLLSQQFHCSVSFSLPARIQAAALCRPSVVQMLLATAEGAVESVRLQMLHAALAVDRMDSAYCIIKALQYHDRNTIAAKLRTAGLAVAETKIQQLLRFKAEYEELNQFVGDKMFILRLMQRDTQLLQKLCTSSTMAMLPLSAIQSSLPFLWIDADLHDQIADKKTLLTADDRGVRPLDQLAGTYVERELDSAIALLARFRIKPDKLFTDSLIRSALPERESSVKALALKMLRCDYITRVSGTAADVGCLVYFLCRDCSCSAEEWTSILSLRQVDEQLEALQSYRHEDDRCTLLMAAAAQISAHQLFMTLMSLPSAAQALRVCDREGRTALHHCMLFIRQRGAAVESSEAMRQGAAVVAMRRTKAMLEKTTYILRAADRDGNTPFMLAAASDLVPCLAHMMTFAPIEVLHLPCNHRGEKALHLAAREDAVDAVSFLITQARISPNVPTEPFEDATLCSRENDSKISTFAGTTPLHVAGSAGKAGTFRVLLDLGADTLAQNNLRRTPIHEAVEGGGAEVWELLQELPATWLLAWEGQLLVSAARNRDISDAAIDFLLTMAHADHAHMHNLQDAASTPLLAAAEAANHRMVRRLLEEGASVASTDGNRCNALHMCAKRDDVASLLLIIRTASETLKEQADLDELLLMEDIDGNTPAHVAAENNASGVFNILLQSQLLRSKGLSVCNKSGKTPCDVAASAGHRTLAVMLYVASNSSSSSSELAITNEELAHAQSFLATVPLLDQTTIDTLASNAEAVLKSDRLQRRAAVAASIAESAAKRSAEDEFMAKLSQEQQRVFRSHDAFTNRLVRDVLALAGHERSSELLDVAPLLPAQLLKTFTECLLVWSPREEWPSVIDLMFEASRWERTPNEQHLIWQWLRVLMLPRRVNTRRSKELCSLLKQFVGLLSTSDLDVLPPVGVFHNYADNPTSTQTLSRVVAALQSANHSVGVRSTQIRRLNSVCLWGTVGACPVISDERYHLLRSLPTDLRRPSERHHWQVVEAALLDRTRWCAALPAVEDLRCNALLAPAQRSFIINTLLDVASLPSGGAALSSHSMQSWIAISSRCIAELSLADCKQLCAQVYSAIHAFAGKSRDNIDAAMWLQMLVDFTGAACELGATPRLRDVISSTARSGEWSGALRRLVSEHRQLGGDRDLDELLNCFRAAAVAAREDMPHRFSFDGTPALALPAGEIEQLREVMFVVEANAADNEAHLNSIAIRERSARCASAFLSQRSCSALGALIAVVREGIFQVIQKRPFRVQCMAVAAFMLPMLSANAAHRAAQGLKGRLGQVATGEGKSIITAMNALMFALCGFNVDVITSSQVLARRDAEEFASLFEFFGISASTVAVAQPTAVDFNAQVLYGTNTDFEFSLLREGVGERAIRMIDRNNNNCWQRREPHVAVVDESDNLLLDAAQHSARIAHPTGVSYQWVYPLIFNFIAAGSDGGGQQFQAADPTAMPLLRAVLLSALGSKRGEYEPLLQQITDKQLQQWVEAARSALQHERDRAYVVEQQQVIILDLDTGRKKIGSRWSNGVHEMVEVKERVPVQAEQGTIAAISHPSFFDDYHTLIGITGTAGEQEEREEILRVYGIDSFDVPPHRPCRRRRWPTRVYATAKEKYAAMVLSVQSLSATRSVLVLLPDIKESNCFAQLLQQAGVRFLTLNETQMEAEDLVIYRAGQVGSVTVATNTAGRGTDFKLSKALLAAGGLHVMFAELPSNLRVECQGLGRSGRQGQPGTSQIFISLEDALVKRLIPTRCLRELPGFDPLTGGMSSEREEDEFVLTLYRARTAMVRQVSQQRQVTAARDRLNFAVLRRFFADYRWLADEGLKPHSQHYRRAYELVRGSIPGVLPPERLSHRLHEWFRLLWTLYFTEISNHRSNSGSCTAIDAVLRGNACESSSTAETLELRASALYKRFLTQSSWPLSLHQANESCAAAESAAAVAVAEAVAAGAGDGRQCTAVNRSVDQLLEVFSAHARDCAYMGLEASAAAKNIRTSASSN